MSRAQQVGGWQPSRLPSYDEVAYPSLPLSQTQPDRMAVVARLLGCRAADPATARVLELGCSDGGNLAWLAAYASGARFLGIDLSAAAIARGRAATSHLRNLELRTGDIAEVAAGEFDFVIAHGVYSWLPAPDDLLAGIDRHLAADGVAYVSYNTKPGWYVRDLAGSVLRRAAAGAGDPLAAAVAARDWVLSTNVDTPHARMLREAMALTVGKPDHVLVHDELSGPSHAPYFEEFVEAAASHELAYLCESHVGDAELAGVAVPEGWAGDEVARQQSLDYARNRAFRQTLLVRPGNAPASHVPDQAAMRGLWAATTAEQLGPTDAQGRTRMRVLGGVELATDSADLVSDLLALGSAWPGNLPVRQLRSDPRVLLPIHLGRGLELRTGPVPAVAPGARPRVAEHVRAQAHSGQIVTCRHELLTLDDDLTRWAVALCDGNRTRAEITRQLAARAGSAGPGPAATLPADLRRALDELLAGLGQAGLMLG